MKPSIRFSRNFILAVALSGWIFLIFASPVIASAKPQMRYSSEITKYSYKPSGPSILLKWPRGNLIFPESNDPDKTNEVFVINEDFASQSELQPLHHHMGLQFFSRNQYNKAKSEYLKALKLKPNSPAIYKNLGIIYFDSKKYRMAENFYRKALQLNPGYTTAIAKLALTLAAQKKYALAEKKFKQAIRAEPSNADHYLNLGHFYYYLKKNYRGAKISYKKALKLNPLLVKAKINLRDIDLKFRKWKDKESDFENYWGSDFDYDGLKSTENSQSPPGYPEESDIAGTRDDENTQRPLF
jgi:tetratricopeptide (TPR) repeat protein